MEEFKKKLQTYPSLIYIHTNSGKVFEVTLTRQIVKLPPIVGIVAGGVLPSVSAESPKGFTEGTIVGGFGQLPDKQNFENFFRKYRKFPQELFYHVLKHIHLFYTYSRLILESE